MKKRILCLALLLCVAVFALGGCVRMRTTLSFSPFGTIDTEIIILLDSYYASMATSMTEEIDKYKEKGYTVEEFTEDDFTGYRMRKTENVLDPPTEERVKSAVEGTKISLDILWDPTEEGSQAQMLTAAAPLISELKGCAEIVISLPTAPIAHNATSVSEDGKTLTWNLLEMGDRSSAHVEISVFSILYGWIIIAACALLVIIAAVVIIIVVATKKKKAKAAAAVEKTSEAGE